MTTIFKEPNERMENERYLEELRQQLVTAIQDGNREKELAIREELKDCGLLSADQIEELESYL